jgi:hypothetical protein
MMKFLILMSLLLRGDKTKLKMIYLKFTDSFGKEARIAIQSKIATFYSIEGGYVDIGFRKAIEGKSENKVVEWSFRCEKRRVINLFEVENFLQTKVKERLTEKQELKPIVNKVIVKAPNNNQASLEL